MKNKLKYFFIIINFAFLIISCGEYNNEKSSNLKKESKLFHIIKDNEDININYLEQYDQNKALYLESENLNSSDKFKNIMEDIGGIGIKEKYILLKKGIHGPHYIVFKEKPSENDLFYYAKKNEVLNNGLPINNSSTGIYNATITILGRRLSCPMRMYFDEDYKSDFCKANAYVELNYKIDMSGSKAMLVSNPVTGRVIKSESGKYIMITVSPYEEGGTGWHLANEISQEYIRINKFDKRDYVGPFANKYNFWIKRKDSNIKVNLIETFPQNTNPSTNVTESRGITVGLSGSLSAGVSSKSPYAVVNLGASVQVTENRNISYNTNEYTIENNSYNGNASWIWNANIDNRICDYLTYNSFKKCYFVKSTWDKNKSWTVNKNKFSAINYKSFTPSFQAIYKTDLDSVGLSTFEIGTNVETGMLLGQVKGFTPVYLFNVFSEKYLLNDITQTFSIDWTSPYFAPEQNIRLQNISSSKNTKCIYANENNKVSQDNCAASRGQMWGYDNEEMQFKSRIKNGYCLKKNDIGYLDIEPCSMSNNQKWFLNSQGLIQLSSDLSKAIGADENDNLKIVDINSSNVIKFEAYKTSL